MKSSSLIKMIEKDSWYIVRTKGSHQHFKHPEKKGIVTIPPSKKRCAARDSKINLKTGWA